MIETTVGNVALFLASIDLVLATPTRREMRFFGLSTAKTEIVIFIDPADRKAQITVKPHPTKTIPLVELKAAVEAVLGTVRPVGTQTVMKRPVSGTIGQISLF